MYMQQSGSEVPQAYVVGSGGMYGAHGGGLGSHYEIPGPCGRTVLSSGHGGDQVINMGPRGVTVFNNYNGHGNEVIHMADGVIVTSPQQYNTNTLSNNQGGHWTTYYCYHYYYYTWM